MIDLKVSFRAELSGIYIARGNRGQFFVHFNEERQKAMTLLLILQQRCVPKQLHGDILNEAGLQLDPFEPFVAYVLLNEKFDGMSFEQQVHALRARTVCNWLPAKSEIRRTLHAATVALLRSPDARTTQELREFMINKRTAIDKQLGAAARGESLRNKNILNDVRMALGDRTEYKAYGSGLAENWHKRLRNSEKL